MARPQAEKASIALKENLSGATVGKGGFDAGLRPLRADLDAAVARRAQRLDTRDKLAWFIAAGIVALFARSFFP
jgi:hypothetical protein